MLPGTDLINPVGILKKSKFFFFVVPKTLPHTHERMDSGIIYYYLLHSYKDLGTIE